MTGAQFEIICDSTSDPEKSNRRALEPLLPGQESNRALILLENARTTPPGGIFFCAAARPADRKSSKLKDSEMRAQSVRRVTLALPKSTGDVNMHRPIWGAPRVSICHAHMEDISEVRPNRSAMARFR